MAQRKNTRQETIETLRKVARGVRVFRRLTAAQERVACRLCLGWSYKRIGQDLGMSFRTVQHHVAMIASLLPEDDLPARERVHLYQMLVLSPEVFERMEKTG